MPEILNSNWVRTITTILSMAVMLGMAYGMLGQKVESNTKRIEEIHRNNLKIYELTTNIAVIRQTLSQIKADLKDLKYERSKR